MWLREFCISVHFFSTSQTLRLLLIWKASSTAPPGQEHGPRFPVVWKRGKNPAQLTARAQGKGMETPRWQLSRVDKYISLKGTKLFFPPKDRKQEHASDTWLTCLSLVKDKCISGKFTFCFPPSVHSFYCRLAKIWEENASHASHTIQQSALEPASPSALPPVSKVRNNLANTLRGD